MLVTMSIRNSDMTTFASFKNTNPHSGYNSNFKSSSCFLFACFDVNLGAS